MLRIGCEVGVLVEIDWGYDEDDKVRVKMNDGEGDWEEFFRRLIWRKVKMKKMKTR